MYKARLNNEVDEEIEDEEYKNFLKNLDAYYAEPVQESVKVAAPKRNATIVLEEDEDFDLEQFALSVAEF